MTIASILIPAPSYSELVTSRRNGPSDLTWAADGERKAVRLMRMTPDAVRAGRTALRGTARERRGEPDGLPQGVSRRTRLEAETEEDRPVLHRTVQGGARGRGRYRGLPQEALSSAGAALRREQALGPCRPPGARRWGEGRHDQARILRAQPAGRERRPVQGADADRACA